MIDCENGLCYFRVKMITGFNTDVQHEGCLYHVQTEDGGEGHPFLESLVYIGGTIIAKKSTPYTEQLSRGATEEVIAGLLKRQHQVIIAAIKAGRIEDLARHYSAKMSEAEKPPVAIVAPLLPSAESPGLRESATADSPALDALPRTTEMLSSAVAGPVRPAVPPKAPRAGKSGMLDLNEVIADYLKRNSEQARLDLKVLTPSGFTAGKTITLNVQVFYGVNPESQAVVTVKVIGTAFRPQVFMGRAGHDGIAGFNLTLPSFSTGTAAIVIEAQSSRGRGELKHLIRRA